MRQSDLRKLDDAEPELREIIIEADKLIPLRVLSVHRTPEEQFKLFKKGRKLSEDIWIIVDKKKIVTTKNGFDKLSKHNYYPSKAVDVAPSPIDWKNIEAFKELNGIIRISASSRNVKIKQGQNWKNLKDYPHQELA